MQAEGAGHVAGNLAGAGGVGMRQTAAGTVRRGVRCSRCPEAEALGIPAAIHLHYAEASHPRVTDEAGNPLADIAPWWVQSPFSATQPGAFPELELRPPIPCPHP